MTTLCIVPNNQGRYADPLIAYCGKLIYAPEAWTYDTEQEHTDEPLCQMCLESDDYALFLLGTVGESIDDPFAGINSSGTRTRRFSSFQPNMSNIKEAIEGAVADMQLGLEKQTFQAILSPTDYASLEIAVLEKASKK